MTPMHTRTTGIRHSLLSACTRAGARRIVGGSFSAEVRA